MDKIDKLIGRLATRSNCTGKAVISLNLGGEEKLKNEIYKLLDRKELISIIEVAYFADKDPEIVADEIIELMKK